MTRAPAPADDALLAVLEPAFAGRAIASLVREPFEYATSSPLETIRLRFVGGDAIELIFKDLAWDRLLEDARASKPRFLHDPRRSIETHCRILTPASIGARCHAAVAADAPPRHWLFLERVAGVELWQVGELAVWESVARWAGRFHTRFAGREAELRAANPYLLRFDDHWFRCWHRRARAALARSEDPRVPEALDALSRYDAVIESLAALPTSFGHGELSPSNVLVRDTPAEQPVCPIDWEMAGTGPGLLDLAALVAGWDPEPRARLIEAYHAGVVDTGGTDRSLRQTLADVDRCELHLAVQWVGWSPGWVAPAEHRRDWIGHVVTLAGRLGL